MLNFDPSPSRGLIHQDGSRTRPAASIILDTGDDLENTRAAVESILAGTLTHTELILLDSGNEPDLNTYLNSVKERREICHLVLAAPEENPAERLNRALALAEGRHIVLADRHARVATGWLDALVGVAELNPEAGLVGPVTNGMVGMQQMAAVDYDTLTGDGLEAFALRQMLDHSSEHMRTLRLGGFCLLIKREVLARLGGLDRRFDGGFYEFNDYSLRAQMAGYQCLIARGCFVHQERQTSDLLVQEERLLQLENQWEIFKRKWAFP